MFKVFEYGSIDKKLRDEILRYISKVLEREKYSSYVEIHIFEKLSELDAFLSLEYREFNIHISGVYFAMHDAYRGWPRIYICIELLKNLPRDVWIGGVIHEAGHAVLHGSPIYYYYSIPDKLLETFKKLNIETERQLNILYHISVAVKDYEVTKYLVENGFSDYQYPFIIYNLKIDEVELKLWRLLTNYISRIEYILRIMKGIAAAIPLENVYEYRDDIDSAINKIVYTLDMKYEKYIYKLINLLKTFEIDTRKNIYNLSDSAADILAQLNRG